ncbi:UbiX family flavin prenyltransferase [Aliirhizobium smilacinae]|uniref:UbiX family flavin prenyltransferase n=1 Tax=Aliirhizobium smilacinae TaxID=1395944 RepID=UPI00319DC305
MLKRVVLGVSGASGAVIALRIGELLASLPDVELHLVVSEAAKRTFAHELGPDALGRLVEFARHNYPANDIGATIASGSFRTAGMIVAPCSMRSVAAIATGLSDNLLTRAADVHLKERRKLILLARETPLHLGHLRNMVAVTEMGATIMPPVPAFYRRPETITDIIDHIAARAIDQLDLGQPPLAVEWDGDA